MHSPCAPTCQAPGDSVCEPLATALADPNDSCDGRGADRQSRATLPWSRARQDNIITVMEGIVTGMEGTAGGHRKGRSLRARRLGLATRNVSDSTRLRDQGGHFTMFAAALINSDGVV